MGRERREEGWKGGIRGRGKGDKNKKGDRRKGSRGRGTELVFY